MLARGPVNHLVPPAAVMDVAVEVANRIVANAPISLRLVKRLVHESFENELTTMLDREVDGVLAVCRATTSARESARSPRSGRRRTAGSSQPTPSASTVDR